MDYDASDLPQVMAKSEEADYLEWDAPEYIDLEDIDLINLYEISAGEIEAADLDMEALQQKYLSKALPALNALTEMELERERRIIARQSSECNEGSPVRIFWDEWAIERVIADRKSGMASTPIDAERDAKVLQYYDRWHFERISISLTPHNSDRYTGLKPGHPLAGYLEQKH